jgi:adenosine deaminase CECR1
MKKTVLLLQVLICSISVFGQQKEAYMSERSKLLAADNQQRFDNDLVLSKEEKSAALVLKGMQMQLLDQYRAEKFFPPSRTFYQSKKKIESTALFKLIEKMPKGGALHLHTEGTTSITWVVNTVLSTANAYVFWGKDNNKYTKGQIEFFTKATAPAGFYLATELNTKYKTFKTQLYKLLTFSSETTGDSAQVWKEFELCFNRIRDFVAYKPLFEAYYLEGFRELIKDHIQYAELRAIVSPALYDLSHSKESNYYSTDSIIRYFKEVAQQLKGTDPDFKFRLVYTFIRGFGKKQVDAEFVNAFRMQAKYPEIISGFDLVGEEDRGHTTGYFMDTWMKRDSLEKVFGLKMDYLFHDGESNWVSDENLYDAVLLGSKRIGHGFNLFLFPSLYEEIKKRNCAIELCPLSSQLLNFTRDLRSHPGIGYLRNGIQCVLSSDDPSIFGFSGLSYDFWSACMAWELDLKALKKLALNSLQYSTLQANEKRQVLEVFDKRWQAFIASVNAAH